MGGLGSELNTEWTWHGKGEKFLNYRCNVDQFSFVQQVFRYRYTSFGDRKTYEL